MKLMTKLLKNRFIMICLSLLMCLILMFSVVSKPVKAIAGIDDAIYFVLATVTASLAINIAVDNPDTGAELLRLWNDLSEASQAAVREASLYVLKGAFALYEWNTATYKSLCDEIASWFVNNHIQTTEYGTITPSNANGYVGFTDDTAFTLYFDSSAATCTYTLSDSVLWIHDNIASFDLPGWSYNSNYPVVACVLKSNVGLEFVSYCYKYTSYYTARGRTFTSSSGLWNSPEDIGWYADDGNFCAMILSYSGGHDMNGSYYYDYVNNVRYLLGSTGDGTFAFIAENNAFSYFGNNEFYSKAQAVDWFASTCGFYTRSYTTVSPYVAPRPAVDFDATRTQQAQDVINAKDTDTIGTYLPGTKAQAQELSDNPAKVWDLDATGVYTGNIQLPDLDNMAWYDKFPFCIPFDVVKLFTNFQATAEAPNFHILILPANSFGFQNDDIYLDINFADYHVLVQIVRFFLSVIFVFWLINVTRKLIGAE